MKCRPRPHTASLATLLAFLGLSTSMQGVASAQHPAAGSSVAVVPGAQGLTASVLEEVDAATRARVEEWTDRPSSGWIPNRGQIAERAGATSKVLFTTEVSRAQVHVTTSGISHFFLERIPDPASPTALRERPRRRAPGIRRIEWTRVDVTLAGARIRPELARLEEPVEGQGAANYYLPHCPEGVLDVPTYGRITFPDVYPGIDWVVRTSPEDGVHHDFVVRPGADASRIRLEYAGASTIELSEDRRSLRVTTRLGEVREGALHCTQDAGRTVVGARFQVAGNAVSIQLDDYDRGRALVIDPPLVWSTYYGGPSWDGPRSIFCDNANDVFYVVGYTNSPADSMPTLDPGGGAYYQDSTGTNQDGFIWKFNQQGVRLWATYYGGSSVEFIADCAVDAGGNLFVGGYTTSSDLPVQSLGGAYNQLTSGGATDGFLVKFGPTGVRQWATYYGGTGSEQIDGITTDANGKLYACGVTTSNNLFTVDPGGGAYYQPAPLGAADALVLKFDATGAMEWGTCFGDTAYDDATGIITRNNDLYVIGYSEASASFPVLDPGGGAYYQGSYQGGLTDAFIARFTLNGVQTWTTYYGGIGMDYADEPVVDASGNLFVVGDTDSPNFPTLDPGPPAYYDNTLVGNISDLYLAKFSASHAQLWSTFYGGSGLEFTGGSVQPIALDAQGNIYVTGLTVSIDFPVLNPGNTFFQGAFNGDRDALIGQFGNNGAMLWSTYLGSNLLDFGTSVSVGNGGCLFATGESSGNNNFPVMNSIGAWYQAVNAGSDDGYIVKFCTPPSSCCLDFNCVPVSTAGQCAALGGVFFANQTCATTVCTIDCTICGTKYQDLDRDGVRDPNEPGLQGWTIQLFSPGGALYAATTTDASGNYCFTGIPCGPWKVNEVVPPGWVQTAPSPNVHALALNTGTTQNGIDFGNWQCGTAPPCPPWPPKVIAWWPWNEPAGSAIASDANHLSPPRNVAQLHLDATSGGAVPDAICLAAAGDHARVPASNQLGLEFAGGSFAITAWIRMSPSSAGPRTIVEKRISLPNDFGLPPQTRGWALFLNGLQSALEIGNGEATQVVAGPDVPADAWTHLAVSIDRAGTGRWYLDGAPQAAFDFMPLAGHVSSGADLWIGQASPAFGGSPPFAGCIADLALFDAPLGPADAARAAALGPQSWCPEFAALPQITTMCQAQTTKQVCFNLCNHTATSQTYSWSLSGLAAGPGCSVAGPTIFTPNSGSVTVASGSCLPPICVTVTRPPGMTAPNATACYELTFMNEATGVCRTKRGTLRNDNGCWCATPIPAGLVAIPGGQRWAVPVAIRHPCDPPATLAYRFTPRWLDPTSEDPHVLSLNGLPPGVPATGTVNSARGSEQVISVDAEFTGRGAPAGYEIVLEADTDGDGVWEALSGTIAVPGSYDGVPIVDVPVPLPVETPVRLATRPNPFSGGTTIGFALPRAAGVALGVYDLSGRLVRSLKRGRLAAGEHRFDWDGQDAAGHGVAAGIYFVRLETPGTSVRTKAVKIR